MVLNVILKGCGDIFLFWLIDKNLWSNYNIRFNVYSILFVITNRPDHVAKSVERMASISEVIGSIPTVVRQNFQPAQSGFHSE